MGTSSPQKKGAPAPAKTPPPPPKPYSGSGAYVDKVLGIQGNGAKDTLTVKHTDENLKSTVETLRGYNSSYGLCSENTLANQWYLNNSLEVDKETRAKMDKILNDSRLSQNQKIESQYDLLKEKYEKSDPEKWKNIQKDRKEIDNNFSKTKSAPKDDKKGSNVVASCTLANGYCVKPNKQTKSDHGQAFSEDLNQKMDKLKADRDLIAAEKKATELQGKAKSAADKAAPHVAKAQKAADVATDLAQKAANAKAAIPQGAGKSNPAVQAATQAATAAKNAQKEASTLATKAKAFQNAATAAQKAVEGSATKIAAAQSAARQATREWEQRVAGTAPVASANALPKIDFGQVSTWEGGSYRDAYIPWPGAGGVSGATVGPGLDLGQQTPATLKDMGLSEPLVKKLSPYCKLKKQEACNFLAKNPLSLTNEEAKEIDEKMSAKYASQAENLWNKNHTTPKFRDLDTKLQTVLVSRQVNAATATSGAAMQAFNKAVEKGDKAAASSALTAIADSLDKNKKSGLINRLNAEADFLNPTK